MTLMSRLWTALTIGTAIGSIVAASVLIPSAPALVSDHRTNDELSLSARPVNRKILVGAHECDLVVTISTPAATGVTGRPALALAIVIDRSVSMRGRPLEDARAAALSVLRQLDGRDAFSIIAYSTGAQTVTPMQPATEVNKQAARAAIETINDEGSTCISCGLETGAYELTHSPIRGGLRRILLISDGQATAGSVDRDELTRLASGKVADGVSISTVGVGLDFDEGSMRRLAEVGRGNYYFVEDTVALSPLFLRELATWTQTAASNVLLTVHPSPRVQIQEAYGYPMSRGSNGEVIVPVADLRPNETRNVVLRAHVAAAHAGPLAMFRIELRWRRVPDGTSRVAHGVAEVDVVDDPSTIATSVDLATVRVAERARSARALEEAAAAYDRDGIAGAKAVLERRSHAVRGNAHLDRDTVQVLEAVANEAIQEFVKEPARAKKTTSVKSYELAR